jgi:ABC-type branched-subunit amino acid transport system ATPase component
MYEASKGLGSNEVNTCSLSAGVAFDHSLPIFAVIGRTGVGKSTFINSLGGRNNDGNDATVCHGLDSCKLPVSWNVLQTTLIHVTLLNRHI